MKVTCPDHIDGLAELLKDGQKYNISSFNKFDEYTFAFEVKCLCGSNNFFIFKDDHPSVIAECKCCGKKIVVYDLKYYPAATKLKNVFNLEKYISKYDDEIFNVCVIYEYSDAFEYRKDVEFDRNDISWCVVYGYGVNSKKIFEIINDETS